MPEPSLTDRIALTLQLPPELARRLRAAAEAQKRPASEIIFDLLDRHLPRADSKPAKIPYA